MKKMIRSGMNAVVGGAGVTAGKIATRQGIAMLNIDPNQPMGIAATLGIAVAAGILAQQFGLKGAFVDGLVYGGAAGAVESGLRLIAPTQASQLLDAYPYDGAGGVGAYGPPVLPALPAVASRDQGASMGMYATGVY